MSMEIKVVMIDGELEYHIGIFNLILCTYLDLVAETGAFLVEKWLANAI